MTLSQTPESEGLQDAQVWSPWARACSWSVEMPRVIVEAGEEVVEPDSDWPKSNRSNWEANAGTVDAVEAVVTGSWLSVESA